MHARTDGSGRLPDDVVLLSTADWDHAFWTNKQHVARELSERGHRVLYVESLGLRRPSRSTRDLIRIARRLRKSLLGPRLVAPNVWVWSPLVLPFHRFGLARAVNRLVLRLALCFHLRSLGIRRQTLWTYNPMTPRLLPSKTWQRVVYHCVDDVAAQPGMPSAAIADAEADLCKTASAIFTTSRALADARRPHNPRTWFLPNAADAEHFGRALDPGLTVPDDLAAIARPRLGFVGALSGYKVDFQLIRDVARARPDWSIVLIGQVGEGDPWTDAGPIRGIANVHLIGPRSYDALPAYMKGFEAGLIPAPMNDYTASMFPMKFFEYLSAGVPVVSTDLPAIREFSQVVTVGTGREGFVGAIEDVLAGRCPGLELRRSVAGRHTYAARTDRMVEILRTLDAGGGPVKPVEEAATREQPTRPKSRGPLRPASADESNVVINTSRAG